MDFFNIWTKTSSANSSSLLSKDKNQAKQLSTEQLLFHLWTHEICGLKQSPNSTTVQFATNTILWQQTARKEQGRTCLTQSYLACALKATLVNTSKTSLAQEALGPEVPGGGGELTEGESLRWDDIAVGILWHRSLFGEHIALNSCFLSRCTHRQIQEVDSVN